MASTELTPKERAQLMAVLRDMDRAAPAEARREARRNVELPMWVRKIRPASAEGRPGISRFRATAVNVSTKGLALRTNCSLTPGDKLVLPLRFREGGGWLVLCEVRNCKQVTGDNFRVGLKLKDRLENAAEDAKIPMDWIL